MKQFVIDELRPADYDKLKAYLDDTLGAGDIDGLYWLPMAQEFFSEIQNDHQACQPFYFAMELESDRVAFELLARTKNRVRCDCIAYATETQCVWLMHQMDKMFSKLEITV